MQQVMVSNNGIEPRAALRQAPWARGLAEDELRRVEQETHERAFVARAIVCRQHSLSSHWIGVIDGAVKVESVAADGRITTFGSVHAGGWLGEGSLLKREPRGYGVTATRDSRIAFMPAATFEWLVGTSLPFSRYLIDQLNARLGYFVALASNLQSSDTDARVAHCIVGLLNPVMNPAPNRVIEISQEEVGRLCGISRRLANGALHRLERAGLLRVRYGAIDVLDVDRLRSF